MVYAGQNGSPEHFGATRMNALGPRLGIAYQLDAKTVIRTGGAVYYQPAREDGTPVSVKVTIPIKFVIES